MARPITRLPRAGEIHLHPSMWPKLWLHYPGVWSNDPKRQEVLRRGFHNWQRARNEFRERHTGLTAGAFADAADRELRRRRPPDDSGEG